jgi:hypothetical protein
MIFFHIYPGYYLFGYYFYYFILLLFIWLLFNYDIITVDYNSDKITFLFMVI